MALVLMRAGYSYFVVLLWSIKKKDTMYVVLHHILVLQSFFAERILASSSPQPGWRSDQQYGRSSQTVCVYFGTSCKIHSLVLKMMILLALSGCCNSAS